MEQTRNKHGELILGYSWKRREDEKTILTKDPRFRVHPQCLKNTDYPDNEIVGHLTKPALCERCAIPIH